MLQNVLYISPQFIRGMSGEDARKINDVAIRPGHWDALLPVGMRRPGHWDALLHNR
jgi:hypothetical protein